ncbi:MAG TPA: thioesterase family protein [Acidimicrobiia bacterium]|nr:thioesterase family protein [Acidimicrobiia bacterium]
MSLREATAVEASGPSEFLGAVAPGWDIAGNANGGYLLAIAARAAMEATGRPDPVSVTAHYLGPAQPGPVTIATRVLKEGRRFATASATLSSNERPLVAILGSFGALEPGAATERLESGPPDLPPPEECVLVEPTETFPPPFVGRIELRLHPDHVAFGGMPGAPRVRGWFRLRDEEPIDTLALLVAVDAFPPTIFFANLPVAWVPTLELTTHLRARPAAGWLRCAFTTRFITGGFLEEDGEVWDSTGRLVAQSRQLALLPREEPA